jgi:D-amino peptidase
MRVYVMTDLEGVCRVANSVDWCNPDSLHYPLACRLLTEEVNAAVDGFRAGGATRLTVVDGHGHGGIDVATLHPDVEYLRGPPAGPYPFHLDDGYDVLAWIGQHAKAGTAFGHLPHTGNFNVADYRIGRQSVGEFAQIALCGALYGVRPVFGSGDAAFVAEATALVPGFIGVAVKRGLNPSDGAGLTAAQARTAFAGAIHFPRRAILAQIRAGAEAALRGMGNAPAPVPLPTSLERTVVLREFDGATDVTRQHTYPDLLSLLNDLDHLT